MPAPEFTVTASVDFSKLGANQKTGLIVMGMDYSYVAVERAATGFRLAKYSCINARDGKVEAQEAEAVLTGTTALLRVKLSSGALCDFSPLHVEKFCKAQIGFYE